MGSVVEVTAEQPYRVHIGSGVCAQAVELVEDAVKVEPLVGRGSRRRGAHALDAVPEAAELVRPEPDLLELIESTSSTPEGQERASS